MRIDVAQRASNARVAVEIGMADVGVDGVRVHAEIGVRERARLVCVLVGMRIHMGGAVAMRVSVDRVGVVVVSRPIRVGNVGVILIPGIRVIAMAAVQVIRVRHIPMVLVRGRLALIVVIAMLHIPEVLVRRVLRRAIQMARAGRIGMILVGSSVCVVRMERRVEVVGMPGVRVIVEREIAMCVGVIAVVQVRVSMRVLMRRGIGVGMVGVRRRAVRMRDVAVHIRMRDVGVRRRVGVPDVGVRCVGVQSVGVRCVPVREVDVVGVILVRRWGGVEVDVVVNDDVVDVR